MATVKCPHCSKEFEADNAALRFDGIINKALGSKRPPMQVQCPECQKWISLPVKKNST